MHISIVTFNADEAAAVDAVLDELIARSGSPWVGRGSTITRPFGGQTWTLSHNSLLAQGNVVAAAELARLYRSVDDGPEFVVFYGCAGSLDPAHSASVFLVERVNYLSLGTVDPDGAGGEQVTLKNKWLCHTKPWAGVKPLRTMTFPLLTDDGSLDIQQLAGIPTARVAATDKVVRVRPSQAPRPVELGPPQTEYTPGEWTYAQALDLVAGAGEVILVEMESYGIVRIAQSLGILDHVIVMRVTTDSLSDKQATNRNQGQLLMDGRGALAHLLAKLFTAGVSP